MTAMKISDALYGIKKVFLDTAPVVYYVEGTTGFAKVAQEVFKLLSDGFLTNDAALQRVSELQILLLSALEI